MMPQTSTARILVVEDDPHIQMLLRLFLRGRFDFEIVGSVDEALQAAVARPFDLFLLDINLGEHRTGVDLLKALRKMPPYQTTQAIACTAYVLRSNQGHFFAKGFNGYLDKPFTRNTLLTLIQELLDDAAPSTTHDVIALDSARPEPVGPASPQLRLAV